MPRLLLTLVFSALAPLLLSACEPYPRDPDETTRMVRESGVLRVGVIHNPPWTDARQPSPAGREIEIVARFAEHLGATPEWKPLGMHEAFAALEHGDVDMLAGGLVKSTPYAKKAGLTRPYEKTRSDFGEKRLEHVLAVRRGENRFLIELDKFLKHDVNPPGGAQ